VRTLSSGMTAWRGFSVAQYESPDAGTA